MISLKIHAINHNITITVKKYHTDHSSLIGIQAWFNAIYSRRIFKLVFALIKYQRKIKIGNFCYTTKAFFFEDIKCWMGNCPSRAYSNLYVRAIGLGMG